ncbi:MAG TPA: histidine kinase [Streptosporangiaceae bacterium]
MTTEAGPALPIVAGRAGLWVAAGMFAGVVGLGVGLGRIEKHPPPVAVVVVASIAATALAVLLVQRRRPMLLYAFACSAGITVIGANLSRNPVWLALLLIAGWCALVGGRRAGLVYWIAAMILFTVEWVWIKPDPGWGPWLAGSTFTFLAGLLIRHQFELVEQLRVAQAGLAAKARAEERNRISRDLHDVIAHTLTVSLLHVMSARLAVEHDPADAARALAEAERLGRESLDEVRQVVGMLREQGDGADRDGTMPLPTAAGLGTLVERFQAAGAQVTLTVDGDIARLPATVGLALYRILQEALTNVIKHAPGAPATARLVVSPREAALTVDSLGAPGHGVAGHGLAGMRERAESLGGTCEAGPSGGGWLVRASFPLHTQEGPHAQEGDS